MTLCLFSIFNNSRTSIHPFFLITLEYTANKSPRLLHEKHQVVTQFEELVFRRKTRLAVAWTIPVTLDFDPTQFSKHSIVDPFMLYIYESSRYQLSYFTNAKQDHHGRGSPIFFVISDTRSTVSWSLSHGNASGRRNQSILVTMLAARRAGSLLLVVTLKPFVLGRTSGVALDAVMVNVRMSMRSHNGSSRHSVRQQYAKE